MFITYDAQISSMNEYPYIELGQVEPPPEPTPENPEQPGTGQENQDNEEPA
jgi:hypothetical protein